MSSELKKTLGRIGDQADPAPTWADLMDRQQTDDPTWYERWLTTDDRRRLVTLALAGLAALMITGAGLWFAAIADNDESRVDTVDQPDEDPSPTSDTPTSDGEGSTPAPGDGESLLPLGCSSSEPTAFGALSLVSAEADIDGDGGLDRIGSITLDVDGSGSEPYLWAELADGTWVVSQSDSPDVPGFVTDWPVGRDLDGDGTEELLAMVGGNTLDRVVVYRYADCGIAPVPADGPATDGFAVQARGAACEDVCNVGLVCLDDGGLAATETTPVDMADKYGIHSWTRTVWLYRNGRLSADGTESGTFAWDEAWATGFANTVSCGSGASPATDGGRAGQGQEDVTALAEALGVETLVATWHESDAFADDAITFVFDRADGAVARSHETDQYRVLQVSGDALQTVARHDRSAGPWLAFDGSEIDCPAVDGWPQPGPYTPGQRPDGGWAVLMEGTEFGDPLNLPAAVSDQWWEIPRWELDCQTGDRVPVPSTSGTNDPNGVLADNETFMSIERGGDRIVYLSGGEGIVTATTDEGRVLLDGAEIWTWSLSSNGSVLVYSDFDGNIHGVDTGTGDELWSVDIGNVGGRLRMFALDDRVVLAGDNGSMSVVDTTSGDLLSGPTVFPNLLVVLAR